MNLPYMFAGFKNGEHTSKNALLCIVLDGGDRTAKPLPAEITDCDLKYGVAQVKPGCHPPPPAPLGISLQENPGWDVLCLSLAAIVPCFRPCTLPHRIWPRFIYQVRQSHQTSASPDLSLTRPQSHQTSVSPDLSLARPQSRQTSVSPDLSLNVPWGVRPWG